MTVNGRIPPSRAWLALAVAVLAISSASVLVRLAQAEGVGSFAMAGWRLSIAALVLVPWVLIDHAARTRPRRFRLSDLALMLVAGVLLAVHFVTWFESLKRIPVALSAVMLATSPVWVAAIDWIAGRQTPRRTAWIGLGLVLAGFAWLLGGQYPGKVMAPSTAWGLALATLSAGSFAGYLTVGRQLADSVSLKDYLLWVTGVAGAICLCMSVSWDPPAMPGGAIAWACLVGLAVVPHLIGHGVLNWSIRRLPVFSVAVATLSEPLGASLLAWLFLGELIPKAQWSGYGLLAAGIFIAAWSGRRR